MINDYNDACAKLKIIEFDSVSFYHDSQLGIKYGEQKICKNLISDMRGMRFLLVSEIAECNFLLLIQPETWHERFLQKGYIEAIPLP